jgi:uncharacterized membrane protein
MEGVASMKRLVYLWADLRSSLWFIPTFLVLLAIVLAVSLIQVDSHIDPHLWDTWPRLFGAGAEGSRGMLAAIASSMITVAGVVFSITIVVLSLASSQYSPRVLHHFMRDRTHQTVLGAFVGIFAYCLVVMRTIRGSDEGLFIPSLAVMGGVVLAFLGIGLLIFFIHHISVAIQASHILATAAGETLRTVEHLFPEDLGTGEDDLCEEREAGAPDGETWHVVPAHQTGYLQRLDPESLLACAREGQFVVRMERGIGEFLIAGTPLVAVTGRTAPDTVTVRQLQAAYTVNQQRTIDQDTGYGIQQIVDVALRALSPGINDTTTAVMSVDYLTAVLVRLASRRIASPRRYVDGQLRVIARGPTFVTLLTTALDQIRRNAAGNVTVLARLLQAVETVAGVTTSQQRRQALWQQVQGLDEVIQQSIVLPAERQALAQHSRRLGQLLAPPCSHLPTLS